MKKLLLMILPAFICAGSLFAQTSTVSGVWERGKTKAVKMFKIVEGGNLSEVATSALGEDGSFRMTFTPEKEGYFVLGTSSSVFQNRYIFYMKPGDPLNVRILPESYELIGKENTAENKEMVRWHDFIFPLEDKAVYFMGKHSTYVDFFPLLEEKLDKLGSYKVKKTKNKVFDTTFADFRKYDFLFNAVQFIYTVRSAHPQKEDFIDYYRQIDIPAIARTTSILNYPGGLRLFVNAYMLKAMVSDSSSAGEKRKNPVSAMLKEDVEMISNDTIKGEIALMFSGMSKTQVGLEQYKQEYGSFLVTDSQKKRWQRIEDNFAENMEKKKPINFTFPDAEGNDVSLSDFRGKVVYIDIWATWCGPCKKEMPAMKALEAEYKDNKDIVFMGISVDASKNIQKWKDFVIKEQLPGVQLFGGDMAGPTLSKPYKITGIPRFMLVGKDGSLIYMDAPRPSSSEIRAVLNDALKK